jgi:hypothetical protein
MSLNKAVVERQMEVTQTSADGLKREFKIVVDAKDIETRIDQARKGPGFTAPSALW